MKVIAAGTAHFRYYTRNTNGTLTNAEGTDVVVRRPNGTTFSPTATIGTITGAIDVEVDTNDTLGLWFVETTMWGNNIVDKVEEDIICVIGSSVA